MVAREGVVGVMHNIMVEVVKNDLQNMSKTCISTIK